MANTEKENDITIAIKGGYRHPLKTSHLGILIKSSFLVQPCHCLGITSIWARIKVASADGRNVPGSFPSVRLAMPRGRIKKWEGGLMASTQSRGRPKRWDRVSYV
ncbi:hypothetical protein AVEN_120499-1 [Araneus ventricosus]|uniref:Uncharacterized protein n=1 Tax=Araneus ventricosus TaxID=182803 RepID=A0A4Y2RWD3_ARAVE|nr:hypothetical protein AVEN_120499-1 [Araneus ventricosus]